MSGRDTTSADGKPVTELVSELAGLVVAYVKQETVDPIKSLGRFVAFGVAGAVLLAIGGIVLTIAAVRAAQGEAHAHLTGSLTWVPYAAGILVAVGGAGWAVTRIGKGAAKSGGAK